MAHSQRLCGYLPAFALAICVLQAHAPVLADTLTFQQGDGGGFSTTDATYIQGNNSQENTNFGTSSFLFAENDPTGGAVARSLLRFPDIFGSGSGQIPLDAVLNSATLTLGKSDAGFHGSGNTLFLHRVFSAWDESNVTWNSFNSGGVAGVDYDVNPLNAFVPAPQTGQATYDLDITQAVQAWLDNPASNEGIIIINPQNDQAILQSEDSSLTVLRPLLSVDFSPVPEPSCGALVLLGTAIFLHRRRLRRRRKLA